MPIEKPRSQFLARQRDPANIQPFLDQYKSKDLFRDTCNCLIAVTKCRNKVS